MKRLLPFIIIFCATNLFAQKFVVSCYFNEDAVTLYLNHIKKTYQLQSPHHTWDNYASYYSDDIWESEAGPVIWSEGTYEERGNHILLIDNDKKKKCRFNIEREGNVCFVSFLQGFSVKEDARNRKKINRGKGDKNKIETVCIEDLLKSSPRFYVSIKFGEPHTPTSEIYLWEGDTLIEIRKNIKFGYPALY